MNRDIAELWIKDLRNNPPQAQRVLFDGKGYCCLGRLCVVKGLEPIKEAGEYKFDGEVHVLPESVREWAGMKSNIGEYKGTDLTDLTQDNDLHGKTLAEIADIIEAHIDEL